MASRALPWLAAFLLIGCASLTVSRFDSLFGPADPARFDVPATPLPGESYVQTIQPILDQRCVVCHACYDAPCQLKTTSWEGIARGASKTPVYDATRLLAATPTRLYVDAHKASEWRKGGFYSVLNERAQTPEANRTLGLMHRMLALKQQTPWPSNDKTHAALDLSPDRAAMCPSEAEMDAYERKVPQGGMPFGLPGLSQDEHQKLTRWIEQGAPYEGQAKLPAGINEQLAVWESFFNGNSLKEQLFARYAYEHLFLAHLYFEGDTERHYFKLVRSSTPPGQAVRIIPTARPVDDPRVTRVYYRLEREQESIVAKTHMPYLLNAKRMARWKALFLTPDYAVKALPAYTEETAANPFATFAALPVGARYRFMLDEAEFTIMGFIKGPVCRGQLALNVIEDQFWVSFLAPSDAYDQATDALLQEEQKLMQLPTGSRNTSLLAPWIRYGKLSARYNQAKNALIVKSLQRPENLNLNLVWDGSDGNNGGRNDNAALTVFRHFDSASVVKGFVGDEPKTAWIIGYPLLERIHYLLVANYDVYGNLGHQTNSRLYMDYLRAEGEFNFIAMLPKAQRIAVRDYWYRDVDNATREQVYGSPATTLNLESGVRYKTSDARLELMQQLKKQLAPALSTRLDWSQRTPKAVKPQLQPIVATRGTALQWLPETAVLVVELPDGKPLTYTLLRNTAHKNVSHLLGEKLALLPTEDTLTLLPGVVGSYPNAFYRARTSELSEFAAALGRLDSEQAYSAFARRWAVRRDNPDFWRFSDALHARHAQDEPISSGLLDYNRLEFR